MLAAMMTTSLVVGCAGGGGETGNGKSESGGDGEKVTLRFSWWGGDERLSLIHICESGSDRWSRDRRDRGEHRGGGGILQRDGVDKK